MKEAKQAVQYFGKDEKKETYNINVKVFNNGDVTVDASCDYNVLGITCKGESHIAMNTSDLANKALDLMEMVQGDYTEEKAIELLGKLAEEVGINKDTIARCKKIKF